MMTGRLMLVAATLALVTPPALAASAHPDGIHGSGKCGTLDVLPSSTQLSQRAERSVQGDPAKCDSNPRPDYDDEILYDDDTYKFRVHYTTDTSDSRWVTYEQVLQTAQVMRDVMDAEGDLGYVLPPDDTIDSQVFCDNGNDDGGNGGNGYYDIYFIDRDNVYGFAQPMSYTAGSNKSATSYLALSTWILADNCPGCLEVTVAHEFFHAIQFTYDVNESRWWMENTAVWMEEQVYDDVNDYYYYLPSLFSDPETALDTTTSLQYGLGIWPIYLTEQLGQPLMLDMWETCGSKAGENAFAAQKAAVDPEYEGGWIQAVLDFRGAMFYPESGFSEGDDYPNGVSLTDFNREYPFEEERSLGNTEAEYIAFGAPSSGESKLNLCFTGGAAETVAKLYTRTAGGDRAEVEVTGSNNAWSATVEGVGSGETYQNVTLVVTYASSTNGTAKYVIAATAGDEACEPGEPGTPTDETPEDTATPGGNLDPDEVTVCGGCVAVETAETDSSAAALFFNMLWLLGSAVVLRRRTR